jgi:hypothetical protein
MFRISPSDFLKSSFNLTRAKVLKQEKEVLDA